MSHNDSIFKYNGKCFTYGVHFFLLKRLISQSIDPQYYIYLFSMGFKISILSIGKKVYTICVEIIHPSNILFVCLFWPRCAARRIKFPNQGLNLGHGNEGLGSLPPNHQGAPIIPTFKIISGSLSYKCTMNWVKSYDEN